jgi:ribosome-associated protein
VPAREVTIHDESIRLGQLLKLANLVPSGGDVKRLLAENAVRVNGSTETRRGRTLHPGDVIELGGMSVELRSDAPPEVDADLTEQLEQMQAEITRLRAQIARLEREKGDQARDQAVRDFEPPPHYR